MKKVKKRFILGENWLYYKIYLGFVVSDDFLNDVILPVATSLVDRKVIDKWFYIRYSDPEYHLRVRFHLIDQKKINLIATELVPIINKYLDHNLAKSIEIGTYERELKRYGYNSINMAETLFHHESNLIINIISYVKKQNDENLRWLFSLLLVDNFLDQFEYSLIEKKLLLEALKDGYGREFGMNTYLRKQLSAKYRSNKKNIDKFINLSSQDYGYDEVEDSLMTYNNNIRLTIQNLIDLKNSSKLQVHINQLVSSFIHMTMNRLFQSENRLHEMVCYDFLYRYYDSKYARLKFKA